MEHSPCSSCGLKGCGSYHDICEKYLMWKSNHLDETSRMSKEIKETNDVVAIHRSYLKYKDGRKLR